MSASVRGSASPRATRPTFPSLAWCAAALWLGMCAAESLAWRSGGLAIAAAVGGASVLVVTILLVFTRRGAFTHGWVMCVLGLSLGLAVGGLFWLRVDRGLTQIRSLSRGASVQAITDEVASRYGSSVRARVLSGPARGTVFSAMLPEHPFSLVSGDTLQVRGSPDASESRDRYARQRHRAGDTCRVRVWSARRMGQGRSLVGAVAPVRRHLLEAVGRIPGEKGALLQGILLGDRSRLRGTALEAAFRTTGLSHVLAVSGTHLVIVAYLMGAFLQRTGLPHRWRLILVFGFAVLYVLLTGAPVSAVRALLMTGAALIASMSGRRGDSLSSLSIAVCLVLCHSPAQAFDVGFALSVSAVLGLIVFSALAAEWAQMIAGRVLRRPARALMTPVVAQAATAPIAIPAFNMVSVIGPVANVLVLPLASVSLGVGVAGAIVYLALPVLGMSVLRLAAVPLVGVARATVLLADVPHAAVPLGGSAFAWGVASALIGAVIWIAWPAPRAPRVSRIAAAMLLASLAWFVVGGASLARDAELVVLDVGQGDAILIRDGNGAVLVDAGADPASLRAGAARVGVRRLDAVFLSHPHADHTAGLAGLTGLVDVRRVYVPTATAQEFSSVESIVRELTGSPPVGIDAGSTVRVGAWRLGVLWPPSDLPADTNCNDTSMVLRACGPGGFSVVLTGDAEAAAQKGIAEQAPLQGCTLLKVPHHGSSGGVDPAALSAWGPQVALISVGAGNEFGHPHQATIDQLSDAGVRVYRTDRDGDIFAIPTDSGFRIETARGDISRGISTPSCATIASADAHASRPATSNRIGHDGFAGPFGSQVRLPHSWFRGPAARAGHRPSQTAFRRCRGP